jgi:hypothetical protein
MIIGNGLLGSAFIEFDLPEVIFSHLEYLIHLK